MSKLAAIIKALMREKDISVTELARQTQISQPVLHRLATGATYNPQIATLVPIANFFAVTLDQLIGNAPLSAASVQRQQWAKVPLLALDEVLAWLEHRASIMPTAFVATDSGISKNTYAIQLNDSTMQPRFVEGTLLIINPEDTAEDQDFVVVHTSDQKRVTCKQFLSDGETQYLKPLNPDFPIIQMNKNHRILGRMVQARFDYDKKHVGN
jgi:SOS-response transcriptional repressor LexA